MDQFSRIENLSLLFPEPKHHYIGYCRSEENSTTFSYTWEIASFWNIYQTMLPLVTQYIESQPVRFQLSADKNKQNLDVFIFCEQKYTGVCSMSIKNSELNFHKFVNTSFADGDMEYLYSVPVISLLKNATKYLPNETLTLYFECTWVNNYERISQKAICTKISQYCNKIETSANEVVLDKKSLATFIIGNERLYANKNIICAKSTIFRTMFNCQKEENVTNEVEITDIKYDILKLLLFYMQFSVLPDLDVENIETLSELFMAADKYDVEDLKLLCELRLIKLISTENYTDFLKITYLKNTKYLNNFVQEFMLVQPKSIYNPELIKLINRDSASLLQTIKYIRMNTVLSCDIKTGSTFTTRENNQNKKPSQPEKRTHSSKMAKELPRLN